MEPVKVSEPVKVEPVKGIEPSSAGWKPAALPLSYTGTAWPFEGMGSMEAWTLPLSDTRTTVSEITRGRELTDRTHR